MANYKKFTKASVGHILAHFDRTAEHPTENIDCNRTHFNYNLAPKKGKLIDILNQRLSEVKVQNRKDVNVLCSWVVTMPKNLPEDKEEEFFRKSYGFLEEKYGKDNVVSAFVHKDEVTPHIHFAFVPVVKDQRNDRLKVSAKECVTRLDLQTFHVELQNHLERELGCEVEILNEATREGNQSIAELKRESATERLEKANEKAERIVTVAEMKARVIEDTAKPIKAECEALQEVIEALESKPSMIGIEYKKPLMGEGYYKVEPKRMEELLAKEKAFIKVNEVNEKLGIEIDEIKKTLTYRQFRMAVGRYNEIADTLAAEQAKSKKLQKELDRYVQKYGVLVQEQPKEEVKEKHRYRSRSKSRETSFER